MTVMLTSNSIEGRSHTGWVWKQDASVWEIRPTCPVCTAVSVVALNASRGYPPTTRLKITTPYPDSRIASQLSNGSVAVR